MLASRAIRNPRLASLARLASSRPQAQDEHSLGALLCDSLHDSQGKSAGAVIEQLDHNSQQALLAALLANNKVSVDSLEDQYLDQLFSQADRKQPDGLLDRAEVKTLLLADRAAANVERAGAIGPPSWRLLGGAALVAGIPYIAFGCLDNCIMLIAGEQIEVTFGQRLGLSTLASAALGNLVSDVCGVGVASHIEAQTRKIGWARAVRLSPTQRRTQSARAARMGGAAIGVSIGCVLGMSPLLFM